MTIFAAVDLHISLTANTLFYVFNFPVTNTLILGLISYSLLIGLLVYGAKSVAAGKRNRFTQLLQWAFEEIYTSTRDIVGDSKVAHSLTPLAATILFAILINNWAGILPGVGSITYDGNPLFRGLAADLNFTFALAAITTIVVQIYAIKQLGFFHNLGRYFINPKKSFINTFEGILELFSEFSRFVALSMRLFGNVFGGEVLLAVVGYLGGWFGFLPLPFFMLMELFVGALQAYVFYMLTVIFVSLAISHHGEQEKTTEPQSIK